jgi:ABC-type branched-subunit amino acid transport system ATPase component/branched-subunit amino acid ABC-type transport system permease component
MTQFLEFALLGLGVGGVYVLLADGLLLIYRGSGVLNFAHGAFALMGAAIFYQLRFLENWSFAPSALVAVIATAALGALTHLTIMRRLRTASTLSRLIATLGVLTLIEGVAILKYGGDVISVPDSLPHGPLQFSPSFIIPKDQFWLLVIAIVITVLLHCFSRYTVFGLAMSATAENQRAAAALGWSADKMAAICWALGCALAAIAGILIVPLSGLAASNLTLIVVAAMAATLVGGFRSFLLTALGGIALGIGQSEISQYYGGVVGLSDSLPFLLIVLLVVVRGRAIPIRGYIFDRMPSVGSGRIRVVPLTVCCVLLLIGALTVFPVNLTVAVSTQIAILVILLSVVVVTGYAGQLSLAPYALAGVGALATGRLVGVDGWPLILALPVGILAAMAVGVIFGLPAVRTRGINLAVVTLGLGLALNEMVFNNASFTGGDVGITINSLTLLGWNINPITYPDRYLVFCLIFGVAACCVAANVRRGRSGRRFLAVRANERSAASLGVNVTAAKLWAFALGAGLAGLGGVLLGFESQILVFTQFDPITSINGVTQNAVGGVAHVSGALLGSGLAPGGVGGYILNQFGSLNAWLTVISGVSVLLILAQNPDGLAGAIADRSDPVSRLLVRTGRAVKGLVPAPRLPRPARGQHQARTQHQVETTEGAVSQRRPASETKLQVRGVTVRFGGVTAVDNVSLEVATGEIVGLVGPNGAGKTTLIDAMTGFVRPAAGSVTLDGADLSGLGPARRARSGLIRSFQGVELLDDLTVLENLLVASDPGDLRSYLYDLVRPGRTGHSGLIGEVAATLGLEDDLGVKPTDLPFGRRRLVSIARAILAQPRVLLLDEPAAGLNPTESEGLSVLIRRIAGELNVGILLVEHDMDLVMRTCSRLVVLNFGKTIADGPTQQVREDEGVVLAYMGN